MSVAAFAHLSVQAELVGTHAKLVVRQRIEAEGHLHRKALHLCPLCSLHTGLNTDQELWGTV